MRYAVHQPYKSWRCWGLKVSPSTQQQQHSSPLLAINYHNLEMSTIASPRASTSIRSPSSTRTSFDASARPPVNPRRNRAALRDYYGIKAANKDAESKISEESTRTDLGPELEEETLMELDKEGFDADAFVNHILATSGLSGVLKVEADLVSRT